MDGLGKMLIRADASPRIGTWSVRRCFALANAWRSMGGQADLACSPLPARLEKQINTAGHGLYRLSATGNRIRRSCCRRDLEELLIATDPDWLVTDSTSVDRDDFQLPRSIRDVVLGNALHGGHSVQKSQLAGAKWSLHPETDESATQSSRNVRTRVTRILAALDSASAEQTAIDVISAAQTLQPAIGSIELFLDRPIDCRSRLADEIRSSSVSVRRHQNPDRIETLRDTADIAITDSTRLWNQIAGPRTATILIAEKSDDIRLDQFRKAAICVDFDSKQIRDAMSELVASRALRRRLTQSSQTMIDSQGCSRLARRLAASHFSLKPATLNDFPFTLLWRNDPEVRANSFQIDCADEASHRKWLTRKIADADSDLFIIRSESGKPVGQFCIDFDRRQSSAELSIHMIPSLRGRGLGTAMIEQACRFIEHQAGSVTVHVRIKACNTLTQAAFQKAGFIRSGTTTIDGQVAKVYSLPPSKTAVQPMPIKRRKAS